MSKKTQSVSLVLGSGGARGHAHIGVIRALEEMNFKVRNIAGSSMGAVIGGIYAADKLDTYTEWAFRLAKNDVVKLLDFSFSLQSVFKGERIIAALKELIADEKIEELDKRFTAVATSLDEQREVWLNSGSLFSAIRASTAVPGIFAPVTIGSRTLVDGGLVNPVPIAPTLSDSTDLTIAVNLAGMDSDYTRQKPVKKSDGDGTSYRDKIASFFIDLRSEDDSQTTNSDPDAAELLAKSIDVMQGAIARLKLAAYAPDRTIEIPRNACSFFEFHRAEEMADLGYERACKALADFKEANA